MPIKHTLKSLEYTGQNLLRSVLAGGAIRAFQKAVANVKTLDEAVTLVEKFRYRRIQIAASQLHEEILGLLKLVQSRAPKVVLEIGSYKGGTFFLFTRAAADDALLISLDLPPLRRGIGYPPWRGRLMRSFGRARQKIELVQGDSQQVATRDKIRALLAGRPVDFLFIDGDHRYEGVKADYELYAPLVAKGGLIAFHDIAPCPNTPECGVPKLWQQVKPLGKATEFVADWNQGAFGIGVIENA